MNTPSSSHDPYEYAWLIAIVLAALWALWYFAGDTINALVLHVKQAELWLLLRVWPDDERLVLLNAAVNRSLDDPAGVSFSALWLALDAVGHYGRWPVIAVLLVVVGGLLWWHPAEAFRSRLNLASLSETVGSNWPYALHALRRQQINIPLDDPQWGMALSEWGFVERHDLLDTTPDPHQATPKLHLDRTRAVLTAQLGPRWQGWADIPAHVQALAGIFALRALSFITDDARKAQALKDQASAHLKALAWAAARHKDNGYLPSLRDYEAVIQATRATLAEPSIRLACEQHAYRHTVLMRLLAEARRNGILPPALFNWLKGVDRPLWYALSTVGRRVPFTESLGSFTHFNAEQQARRALALPVLDNAIDGLQMALQRTVRPATSTPKLSRSTEA